MPVREITDANLVNRAMNNLSPRAGEHRDVTTSEPVCLLCMAEEVERLQKIADNATWVLLSDRLPEDGQRVLFCDEHHPEDVGIGFYMDEDKQLWIEGGGYWMPMPPLPTHNMELTGNRAPEDEA